MRTEEATRETPGESPSAAPPPASAPSVPSTVLALAVWAALIVVAHLWGRWLLDAGHRLQLGVEEGAPPIVGDFDIRLGVRAVPAVALAVLGVAFGPRLAAHLGWTRLLLAAGAGALAWNVALAFTDVGGITGPMFLRGEYIRTVGDVGDLSDFLVHFTDRLAAYDTHVQSHPPGMVLILWAMDRLGLSGIDWASALVLVGGAAGIPAVLMTVRAVAGTATARTVAPFLVLSPAAVWMATTPDGTFMAVAAAGVALVATAGTRPPGRRSDLAAIAGGICGGAALMLSYGLALMAPVAAAVAFTQRRWRPLLLAGAVAAAVVGSFTLVGVWWVEGLFATRIRYLDGVASRRPYSYFLVANLAAFAVVVGPATAVALSRLWRLRSGLRRLRGLACLVVGGLAAVAAADLSGLSKAEVERIWLPFAPWVLAATAVLSRGAPGRMRAWLGLQVGVALAVQLGVRTPW
ncbi:MAG: hypothetical protein ACRDY7_15795 [Acidimicrobiia bacterium]